VNPSFEVKKLQKHNFYPIIPGFSLHSDLRVRILHEKDFRGAGPAPRTKKEEMGGYP
jgi:hypothetical protein